MKKYLVLILALIVFLCSFSITVFAHSGGTDEDGGHYDSSAGEYHYHHGYPAHSHDGGECPYDFEDNVDQNRGHISSNNNQMDGQSKKARLTWWQLLLAILLNAPWVYAFFSCVIIPSFRSANQEQILHKVGSISVLVLSSSAVILFFTILVVLLNGITMNRIITTSVCSGLLALSAVALLIVNRRK